MKKVIFPVLLILFTVCICEAEVTQSKMLNPSAVVAPTSNEIARIAYNTGSDLLDEGNYEEAEKYLRQAIELDSGYIDAYDHLGRALRYQGKTEEAIEILEKSISLMPGNSVPYTTLYLAYEDIQDYQSALDTCNRAIENIPNDPEGYYNGGTLFYEFGYYEEAIEYLLRAAKLYMESDSEYIYDATYSLGFSYFALEDWEHAAMYLGYTLNAYPDNITLQKYYQEAARKAAETE